MSHAAYFDFDEPVSLDRWTEFCQDHGLVYSPNTVGQNHYYAGDIEVMFGYYPHEVGTVEEDEDGRPLWDTAKPPEKATQVRVSTFYGGDIGAVAGLAASLWLWTNGQAGLRADEDVAMRMLAGPERVF